MDNTINCIAKIKAAADRLIIRELDKNNIVGLVPSHGDIIVSLLKKETLSMSDLARMIRKEPATTTVLVKKLSEHGYLEVFTSIEDKRMKIVRLTKKGLELESIFYKISTKIFEIQYAGLDEDTIKIMRRGLEKMMENFRLEEVERGQEDD